ncbi:MAG: amino acid decarboxylase [Lachnospiraceae bacterium]|nr:amino acid decarboxylase [Lachnospiraceae bacterium]
MKSKTPVLDFLNEYEKSDISRLHMPGHKGKSGGFSVPYWLEEAQKFDITEISGADNLYNPSGIIMQSEENAGKIFGAKTLYSTEGSSQAIKAMLYLAKKHFEKLSKEAPYVVASGKCHKAFFHAVELLGLDVKRLDSASDLKASLGTIIDEKKYNPIGVYITYPDYFGNVSDLKNIKEILSPFGIPLLVDGAHCAYFKFLDYTLYPEYIHPVDCGADICCASAHKTLPTLTGTAYLHINDSLEDVFDEAKHAMELFGSSSPSYLLIASMDAFNGTAAEYKKAVCAFCEKTKLLKNELSNMGFNVGKSDPLRIVVLKDDVFTGKDFAACLKNNKCECECFDKDYVIMMLSPLNDGEDLNRIKEAFLTLKEGKYNPDSSLSDGYSCLDNFK